MTRSLLLTTLLFLLAARTGDAQRRRLTVEDYFRIARLSDVQASPDGDWIAYVATTYDLAKDGTESRLWMVPAAGGPPIPLTRAGVSSSSPRWSPDGRRLAFLSARDGGKTQVWTLDRRGGEAESLTDIKQGVSAFEWSPDAERLVLVLRDPSPDDLGDSSWAGASAKTPRPWVIDRLQFKRDYAGYLTEERNHLYVFDVASHAIRQITAGAWDDSNPAWSPDGRWLAFVSNRDSVDGSYNSDLWLVAADDSAMGASTRRLTTNPGQDGSPSWSPDGTLIAYTTQPSSDPIALIYDPRHLAVVPAAGGAPRSLTATLDRELRNPRWSRDGRAILAVLEDRGTEHLVRVDPAGGRVTPLLQGDRSVGSYDLLPDGTPVGLVSDAHLPDELFALEPTGLRQLTRTNVWLDSLVLGEVRRITAPSRDGTPVEAFLYTPPDYEPGRRYPTLLRIHGGPVSQYELSFNFDAQLFAAHGYAVVMANPRGSSGYGSAFSRAIMADWGNKDYEDVLAAVDEAVRQGVADPDRLGVGGWSYGGILTNYVITKSQRFKGAISGASEALYTSNYGHDHYQYLWEIELGLPWRHQEAWDRISPFWSVERIVTPTLWIGGEKDWNVPILNSEQMYQAMRRLGRQTELVVYPGEHHGIRKPSYLRDRYERYLAWYDRYVKPE